MVVSGVRGGNILIAAAALFALPAAAFAQGYQTGFDTSSGWTLDAPAGGVGWTSDSTPGAVPGGPSVSGNSLNYNNAVDYVSGGANSGNAASPVISLAGLSSATFTFWCNFQTEPGSDDATFGYDVRQVTITPGAGSPITESLGVTNGGATVGACSAMGTWHQHTIPLNTAWGTVQVAFQFDSVDSLYNDYAGWFIDDFAVSGPGGGGPPPPAEVDVIVENFDGTTTIFSFDNPSSPVEWKVDGLPAGEPSPGGPAFSAPNSMNFNDDVDYDNGGTTVTGSTMTGMISLSTLDTPKLRFYCNYRTESTGATWDKRWLEISSDGFATNLLQAQLAGSGATGISACAAMGTWHEHVVTLNQSWGSIQLRFRFDSVDGVLNNYAGWFIDDFRITALSSGVVGGSLEGKRDNDNGDENFLKTICAASSAGRGAGFPLVAVVLSALALAGVFRRLR